MYGILILFSNYSEKQIALIFLQIGNYSTKARLQCVAKTSFATILVRGCGIETLHSVTLRF